MAFDLLPHVSIFKSGAGPVVIPNTLLGTLTAKTMWITEQLELALGASIYGPETHPTVTKYVAQLPWFDADGKRLNTLVVHMSRMKNEEWPALWTAGHVFDPDTLCATKITFVRDPAL